MSFTSDVAAWVRKSENRMNAVLRDSAQTLIREAQTPRAKGGNMPVDTGFLRNSGMASLTGIPRGESNTEEYTEAPIILVINRARAGDTIWFGWTANYAPYMEVRYGYMRKAAQRWPDIVARSAVKIYRSVNR